MQENVKASLFILFIPLLFIRFYCRFFYEYIYIAELIFIYRLKPFYEKGKT